MFQGFNSAATNSSPFGQSTFGAKPGGVTGAGTGFGGTAFGGGTSGGSLFGGGGVTGQTGVVGAQTTGGLFGSGAGTTPAFGQAQTAQPSFGGFTGTGGGLFGSNQQTGGTNVGATGGGLFGGSVAAGSATGGTSAFGAQAKPGFGGFGTAASGQATGLGGATGGLFSQSAAQSTGQTPLFGGATASAGGSGLFGSTAGSFGATASAAGGGTTIKFTPVTGSDTMVKSGQTTTINTRHHCITCMKEYEAKSLEELRLEDYVANRKGPQQGVQSGGLFGAAPQPSLFGSNPIGSTPTTGGLFSNTATSGFGTSNSVFGSSGSSLFAKPATAQPTAFGSTPATNSTNTFGFNTGTTASNPFATNTAQKPFGAATPQTGTGLFGNNTSQQTNVFGSTTTGGFGSGFGTSTQNQTSLGLFNQNKPFQMGGTAAGTTQGTPNFSFGQTANTSTGAVAGAGGSSLFGAKPATGGFGTFGQPAAGTQAGANRGFGGLDFGANTQTQTLGGGGGFGTFNKPATPFSFGQSNTTNTTLGGGLNLGGGSTLFGNTAAKPNLFGSSTSGGGLFGTGQSTFGTGGGTGTFGTATSGGMLGGGSLLGGLGSSSLMMPGTTMQNNQNVNNPLNQQIMALASVPFGDMSLFKNVLQITGKTDELLKPTSPAAQKAINSGQNFTISPRSGSKIKVKPIGASNLMKKSLFGGLEDHEDTNNNNNDSWLVKPSPKRLILRTKPNDDADVTSQGRPHSRLLNLSGTNSSNNTPGAGGGGNQDEEEVTFLTLSTPKFIQQRGAASTPANKDAETQSGASADKNKDQSLSSPTNKSNTSLENNDNTPGQQKGQSPSGNKSLTEDTSWAEKSVSNYTQTQNQSSENKENADHSSSSTSDSELEESLLPDVDQSQQTPHPTGIRLRRVGYYTIPSLSDLAQLLDADGRCVVDNFTIGRLNYGNVFYPDSFDVSGLNIDEIVHIRHKEIVVYPDDTCKPPLGTGLNRRAQVTLDRVWPSDKNSRLPISDPQRLAELDYEAKLRKASAKNKTRFVEYRPQTGSWVFKVDHFSKYGLSDSEEEDAAVVPSDVKKLKLTKAKAQLTAIERPPLRGLDMAGQTLMSETNGLASNKPVFLDEGDQDMCDLGEGPLKSLFDGNDELDLNHKSPTARFANGLGTTSHKVQMMKQSFYHDDEEDEFNEYNDEYMDMGDFRADSILDVDAYERDLLKKSKMAEMRNGISLLRSHFAGSPLYDGAASSPGLPMPPALASPALAKVKDLLPSAAVGKPGLVTSPALLSGPPPPVIVPQSLVLKLINRVVPWSQSVTYSQQAHCLSEFSVFMGRRFKVGWSPSCTLLSLSSEKQSMGGSALQADLGSVLSPRAEDDFSPFVVQRLRLKGGLSDDIATDFQESIEEHMEVALVHSIVGDEDGCPVFAPSSGNDELHAHCAAAHATAHASPETAAIWQLCDALWGDLPGAGEEAPLYASEEGEGSYWAMQERKRAVSGWLEACAQAAIKDELSRCSDNTPRTVFTLLTAHHILDACNTAQDNREHFMALLLSQVGCGAAVQTLAEQQLAQWTETRADELVDRDRLKLVQLVAGLPLLLANGAGQGVVNVCEALDWRRALALHLWYLCKQSATVTDALLAYETAFQGEDGYAAKPVPHYSSEWETTTSGEPIYDVCYHLLRLYSFRSHPLERLLNPATHTSDPLDYRLSWLLMRVLDALGYSHLSQLATAQIHTAFALQLESHGCWHWAVFVLLHLSDGRRRRSAVEDMMGRHVTMARPDELTEEERFVLEKLRLPKKWLFTAKATLAKSLSRHEDEAIFLLEAEDWNHSHEVIMQHIAAKAIINEKNDYMWRLLVALVGERQERAPLISGWEQRGALIWHYLRVVDEVKAALERRNPYSLEKLQPELTSLCTRIVLLPTPTSLHRLCQAEIVKRIANLIYSLFVLQRKEGDFDSVSRLARLISNLPLPEDYAHQEMRQMVTSWLDTTL